MWTRNKINLLKLIIKNKQLTVEELAKIFKLKKRQIYVYIKEINFFLNMNKKQLIKFEKSGFNFSLELEDLKKIIYNDFYLFSQEERINLICFDVILSTDLKATDNYSDLFQVSKNTILLDIKKISNFLKKYNLNFAIKNNKFYITGNEIFKRHFLINYISTFLMNYEDFIIKKIFNFLFFKNIKLENILSNFWKETKINIDENYNSFILVYLHILKIYYQKKSFINMSKEDRKIIEKSKYFNCLDEIYNYLLEDCELKNTKDEKHYLTILLTSGNICSNFELVFKNIFSKNILYDSINKMLLNIEKTTFMFFYDKDELIKGIETHLILSYFRIKYLPINLEYVDIIKKNYKVFYEIAVKNIVFIENVIKIKFLEDEIALITLYLANNLFSDTKNLNKVRTVILHDGKINVLKNEIDNNFSNVTVVKECHVKDFKKINEPFDLVLTSVNFNENVSHKVLRINRILTEDDKEKIDNLINEIIDIKTNKSNNLLDILSLKHINIHNKKILNWENAIEISSQSLINNGNISEKYVKAMIKVIDKYGTVVTLSSNIAMPHASFKDGVNKIGFSLNIFKNEIEFPKSEKINIILVLAPIDRESHIKPMFQFLDFIKNKNNIKQMLNKKVPQEIFDLITSKFTSKNIN